MGDVQVVQQPSMNNSLGARQTIQIVVVDEVSLSFHLLLFSFIFLLSVYLFVEKNSYYYLVLIASYILFFYWYFIDILFVYILYSNTYVI